MTQSGPRRTPSPLSADIARHGQGAGLDRDVLHRVDLVCRWHLGAAVAGAESPQQLAGLGV